MYNTPDYIKWVILGIACAMSAYVQFDVLNLFFYLNLLRPHLIQLLKFRVDKLHILRWQIIALILAAWFLIIIWKFKLGHFLFGRLVELRTRNVIKYISYWKGLIFLYGEFLFRCWLITHCFSLVYICIGVLIEHHGELAESFVCFFIITTWWLEFLFLKLKLGVPRRLFFFTFECIFILLEDLILFINSSWFFVIFITFGLELLNTRIIAHASTHWRYRLINRLEWQSRLKHICKLRIDSLLSEECIFICSIIFFLIFVLFVLAVRW